MQASRWLVPPTLILLGLTLFGGAAVPDAPSVVTVQGRQLIVQKRLPDGTLSRPVPYSIKGVGYVSATRAPATGALPSGSPPPPISSNQYGFFFDFGQVPPGHDLMNFWIGNEYFAHYPADIPLMAQMHINTVRVYVDFGTDPAAYKTILDAFYSHGIMVIMTLVNSKADIDNSHFLSVIQKCQNHPAVLMWLLGNEWNLNNPPLFGPAIGYTYSQAAADLDGVAVQIKAQDPNHPVSSSLGDGFSTNFTQFGENDVPFLVNAMPHIDIWNLNIYRGPSFGNLFSQWALTSAKPFYFGEFGTDAFRTTQFVPGPLPGQAKVLAGNEDQQMQADFDIGLWQEIQPQLSGLDAANVCAGGLVWTWNDQLWKVGNFNVGLGNLVDYNGPDGIPGTPDDDHSYDSYNPDGFALGGSDPDGVANQEYYGLVNADRVPRLAYQTLRGFYATLAPLPLDSIAIAVPPAFLQFNQSISFAAQGLDAFQEPLLAAPVITWSVSPSADVCISPAGVFTSGRTPGRYVVTATSGRVSNSVSVTVASPTDFAALRVFPNPWRSDRHAGGDIKFDGLTADATVKIFTVSGHWVRTLGPSDGKVNWDRRNDAGDLVASGLYLYVITNGQGQRSRGKIAIIR